MMNKYHNVPTEKDGRLFASKKEANRDQELVILERVGEISNLQRQVRYPLVVNGVKVATYVADHVYDMNGSVIVEDTKSEVTQKLPTYRMKKKLMKAVYGIDIVEV